MSLHSDRPYLAVMRDTARKVLVFTEGLDHERFHANEEKQWVVIRGIEVVGEASTKVSPEFIAAHRDMPWSQSPRGFWGATWLALGRHKSR